MLTNPASPTKILLLKLSLSERKNKLDGFKFPWYTPLLWRLETERNKLIAIFCISCLVKHSPFSSFSFFLAAKLPAYLSYATKNSFDFYPSPSKHPWGCTRLQWEQDNNTFAIRFRLLFLASRFFTLIFLIINSFKRPPNLLLAI